MTEDRKAQIKEAIRQLHAGVPPEQVKEKFRHVFEGTDSLEIAKIGSIGGWLFPRLG